MRALDFARIDHVYIRSEYTDLRKGIDGLRRLVESSMRLDPYQNSLFLFCGRKSSTIKGLLWEEDGFLLITKRLEDGRFQWPRTPDEVIALGEQQLRWLLDGLSIVQKNAIKPARKPGGIV
ncbi:IS66 family insertion sequence element accessory protein TnpB [Thomasclavelia cocleata]|uniref:IS66 family insertion sequence element accessory protein TnpB n=1 Tax=Thomasclavelia cocleata TaxID=69824 RepID=UPI002583E7AD|nr:IS66 family insertion sequence element accessory protein TnpB [Thomasclavelia cocleata]